MKIQHKFLVLLPFLLFFSVFTFSQQGKNSHLAFKSLSGTDTLIQEVFLGGIFNKEIWIIRNPKKDTLEISEVKNGKLHGAKRLLHIDGELKLIANYKKGLLNGKVEYFAQDSQQILRTEHYKAIPEEGISVLHGKVIANYHNGGIKEEFIYKEGFKNGKYTIYQQNGSVKERGKFKDDLNIRNKLTYGNNGNLQRDEHFIIIDNPKYISAIQTQKEKFGESKREEIVHIPEKLSVLDGSVKYYHYNGDISSDLNYLKGEKYGICKEYHQDKYNRIKSIIEYKDGLPHGSYIHYNANGPKEREGNFYSKIEVGDTVYNNVYEGEIKIYNDGKLQRIESWSNFKKNGVQENYSSNSGKLIQRTYLIDNLKTGSEERFDADGIKNYEGHFEIGKKDGKKVSQQTGTETTWVNGKLRSKRTYENGKIEGLSYSYYENGNLERVMNSTDGELDGLYKSYYENGQLKEDYMYHRLYNSRKHIGWNKTYDKSGKLTRIFHAQGNDKNSIGINFKNGQLKELGISDGFLLSLNDDQTIKNILWQRQGRSIFGYYTFTNGKLRKIEFDADLHHPTKANFTSTGELIQVYTNTGNTVEDAKLNTIAEAIATQYNPKWSNEKLITEGFKDGKYQWNYKDGSPFFKIEFKDSLLTGKCTSYNPIDGDTLTHAEISEGLPVGTWVEKTIDGINISRVSHFENHKIKESYRYGNEGILKEVRKYDSLGKEYYFAEYYENANLKSMREPILNNSISLWDNGDTSNFNFLYANGDSIKVERQFYEGNILRLYRKNNLTTGFGEAKTYFKNGQLQTRSEQKDGKSHGLYQQFNESGRMLYSGFSKDGKRHGQWINYNENGETEISLFENGEIVIDKSEEDPNSCRCYDKSLKSGNIGYAGSLSRFEEYEVIKNFIPKTIIPIDSFNYENIFYVGLQTDNNHSAGFTSMKLLMFKEFAFHYPTVNHLKFNLNPCKTEGYISNIRGGFNYSYSNEKTVYASLSTKTIAVGLVKNPLVDMNFNPYTIQFETKGMNFDEKDIKNIEFIDKDSTCYPPGIINNLIKIEIKKAELDIQASNGKYFDVPLLPNEAKQFYGFNISDALIEFEYVSKDEIFPVNAKTNRLVAGANYVAGKLEVQGKSTNAFEFVLESNGKTINTRHLKRFLEHKGFYRVKVEPKDNILLIEFYTEK